MYSIIMMTLGIVAGMIGGIVRSKYKINRLTNKKISFIIKIENKEPQDVVPLLK